MFRLHSADFIMPIHVYIVAQVSYVANGPLFIIESIEAYFVCHIACRVYVIWTKYAKTGIESVYVYFIVIDKRINHLCFIPCYEHFSFKGKFLPLKTPLDDRYNDMIPEFSVFNLDLLFGSLKTMKARILVLSKFRQWNLSDIVTADLVIFLCVINTVQHYVFHAHFKPKYM